MLEFEDLGYFPKYPALNLQKCSYRAFERKSYFISFIKRKFYQPKSPYSYHQCFEGKALGKELVTTMEDIKALKMLLRRIKGLDSVSDALLMTKTGMFVLGSMRRSRKLERFMGMVAILAGSAEATSLEFDDPLKGVIVSTKNSKIAVLVLTENILLVVTFLGKKDDRKIFDELSKVFSPE
ncbi:MAG: roadblock/LC7 domain-containing protein [Thermoplasmata archaeon]|nr:MAG: roadblock/LC7 domain-containing protein [Thermoplasmata archaeon]